MDIGKLYFIKDDFFEKYKDFNLMQNKEINKRPCFYAVKTDENLYIMIPISSKLDKYKNIYDSKIQKYKVCDTLVFGNLLGYEKAFLIQNLFFITEKYIDKEYIDKNLKPIGLDYKLRQELILKTKKVIGINNKLIEKGKRGILLTDVFSLREKLLYELNKPISLKDKLNHNKKILEVDKTVNTIKPKNISL